MDRIIQPKLDEGQFIYNPGLNISSVELLWNVMPQATFAATRLDPVPAHPEGRYDPQLNAICRTAAVLFGVRYAFASHLSEDCQLFLGREGFRDASSPPAAAFCALTMLGSSDDMLVVPDTWLDPRFATNPFVMGEPYLRFYAGVPIRLNDDKKGATVCIADPSPRATFGETDRQRLCDFASFVAAALRGREATRATRRAQELVEESEQRFRLLAESANDVFILGDLNLRRTYVSPASREIFGYEPEELIGILATEMLHPDDVHIFDEHWSRVRKTNGERTTCCIRHRHRDGYYVWVETSVALLKDADPTKVSGYVAVLRDVTARIEADEQMRYIALHDALTGLPNRALFRDRLGQAIAQAARSRYSFAVLMCDLDRFKTINDSLGHPAGDLLLRIVANRMEAVLRPYDTVARLGGDEFALILNHLDEPDSAASMAEKLLAVVSEPIDLDGQTVDVGISIGFVLAGEGDNDSDELFKRADIALYEAKAAGRATFRKFCHDTGERVATRSQLGLDIKDAIRRGEFHLAYQPVVDAITGVVESFEALMRWHHPVRGEVSPVEFIPLAEETGLIIPLGAWALCKACREAMAWPDTVRVGVNVSAVQFRGGLEETVISALAAAQLPAHRLKLEVTESVLMRDADGVLACLHRLRAIGVQVALDDFGTGYSSLAYLRRFPFDKIKIDRSFIRDIADPEAAAIVRAVVGIGERLGMGIVVEGVETAEQLELVRREGCHHIQGFLFSKPLTSEEARAYVVASRPPAR